ncbi:MAG: signal peptidase II [Deltaproteobacteria bacterium]|nr:signal peptidase II [Deltaproteobacteria bacterium]MBW2658589.1 signal peptidase II [Deltaproteobacteria bacterium]
MRQPSISINRTLVTLLSIVFVLYSDQYTKAIANKYLAGLSSVSLLSDTLILTYVENSNGFLGMVSPFPWYLKFFFLNIFIPLLLLCCLYHLFYNSRLPPSHLVAFSFITAGGISNLLDRIIHNGVVIDFMQLHIGPFKTGICNLADLYIIGGSFLLGFLFLKTESW